MRLRRFEVQGQLDFYGRSIGSMMPIEKYEYFSFVLQTVQPKRK